MWQMNYADQMVDPSMQGHSTRLAFVVIAGLMGGALLVMWIGELITEYGVGNGASLIIMAGIISSLYPSISYETTIYEYVDAICIPA